jgi:hypothetical protein
VARLPYFRLMAAVAVGKQLSHVNGERLAQHVSHKSRLRLRST